MGKDVVEIKPKAAPALPSALNRLRTSRCGEREQGKGDAASCSASGRGALVAKRVAVVLGMAAVLAATLAWMAVYGKDALSLFTDGPRLQAWVGERGLLAPVLMALLVVAQVVVAVLPGEPLELGAGYAFGFWEGTALCLVGSLIGTVIVVALTRTVGIKVVELFFSREKIESVSWLRSSKRFELILFVCFLIPGTPKDIMTYVAGLTPCRASRIAAITTIGRIPSIISSTLASAYAAEGNWAATAIVAGLTLVLVVIGVGAYALVAKREKSS
ncbi:TVP38/TMEM64 family protein [Raoultibacter phocaeensis]|uniref:TVP38/TMEM64 family protein n=1 Tax=Raoultibacter phocaeensis TaxID=2479841 RepID=UPI002103BB92|nr:VTT domain-containing protein [Raoultibacter phocaeensis]